VIYKLKKLVKKTCKWLTLILVSTVLLSGAVIFDLSVLGDKPEWNRFDQLRVWSYGLAGSWVGIVAPPVGPLKFVSIFAPFANHFLTSSLPEKPKFSRFRSILESEEFCTRLSTFKSDVTKGGTRTKRIIQRVHFSKWPIKLFDDIAVFLLATGPQQSPHVSYLVWGMGIVPDKRAPVFFGRQLGSLSPLVPLRWINRLEEFGLAKGYWILLTDNDETSSVSYSARLISGNQRIKQFVSKSKQRAKLKNQHQSAEQGCLRSRMTRKIGND
jgi:hypothetical protein